MSEPWYRDAVIYAVDVPKFADSDGDGIGDFRGLASRMRYLHDLGVSCLWLLPCYPSARRDNGYDITDYYGIDPKLGTLEDFLHALHCAGEYGIQVIMDLVVEHTSDLHPWFQAARRDERSTFRSYYMWAGQPPPLPPDLKNVLSGEEDSVWSYDETARSYFFHRFYRFEPALNLDNPDVVDEIKRVMDFWLSLGIAGYRLDAVAPMMADHDMTGHDRRRDPHVVLRNLFDALQQRRPHAALLGEVDVESSMFRDYFAGGRQLNMLLNFLADNYLFLALARGEAEPISNVLRDLPRLPEHVEWVNFLRNLDELDLERLSADEREEVMQAFAPRQDMRIFGRGIRRRLAPMLKGDVRRLKMVFSLLMSLPGVPLLVYGDEIGMGDDLAQDGRNAVRAPMQWTASRNGGFSTAPKRDLVQPMVSAAAYAPGRVNVESQREDPGSLWQAVRSLIALRRSTSGITHARWQAVETGAPAVLGHGYRADGGDVFMLHNLGRKPQRAHVQLADRSGCRCTDLLNAAELNLAGNGGIELEPFGYRWLQCI